MSVLLRYRFNSSKTRATKGERSEADATEEPFEFFADALAFSVVLSCAQAERSEVANTDSLPKDPSQFGKYLQSNFEG